MKTIFRILVKNIAIIISFLALILSCFSLYLQYNPKPEPALKNITGHIDFDEYSFFNRKPGFIIFIKNKGISPQKLSSIQTDKGENIHRFYSRKAESRESWLALDSYNKESIFLDITPSLLKKLRNTNGLFVLNNVKDKKKIISKKDIQKALKSHKTSK